MVTDPEKKPLPIAVWPHLSTHTLSERESPNICRPRRRWWLRQLQWRGANPRRARDPPGPNLEKNPPSRVNHTVHKDSDLSGPILLYMSFCLFQLLAGEASRDGALRPDCRQGTLQRVYSCNGKDRRRGCQDVPRQWRHAQRTKALKGWGLSNFSNCFSVHGLSNFSNWKLEQGIGTDCSCSCSLITSAHLFLISPILNPSWWSC